MPAAKTRKEVLTEFRQTEILNAARAVFAERGFNAATMDMIAAEAGIAKGTLYLYFDSKDAIFWASVRSRFQELLEQTKVETAKVSGAKAKLQTVLRVRFAFLHSDEPFLRMYFTEFGHLCRPSGPHQTPFREIYNEGAHFLAKILAEGVRKKELRKIPPLESAMALMDLSRDVFAMRFLGLEGHKPGFQGEKFVFDLFWNGVAAVPERRGER